MKAIISMASDFGFKTEKEIENLEDLKEIQQKYNNNLVIRFEAQCDIVHVLIYDI